MSLVVNTNVSSLTAQRALAYADSLQGEAMQRLSTGSKINSALTMPPVLLSLNE